MAKLSGDPIGEKQENAHPKYGSRFEQEDAEEADNEQLELRHRRAKGSPAG